LFERAHGGGINSLVAILGIDANGIARIVKAAKGAGKAADGVERGRDG
jgi:hypothetical protein